VIKTILRKKKCKKAKWLSEETLQIAVKTEETLQIAVKRREEKGKVEKERKDICI